MRKVIKYVVSFFFIFLLFPISLIAGEIIEADCEDPEWVYLNEVKMRLLINTDGGKQTIADENFADVTFTKDKVVMKERDGDTLTIDIESGSLYYNGKNIGHCIFSNLEVLEKGNTADADDGEIIQLLESIKIQQDKILEKLDAHSITDHSLLAHEHGKKVSVPSEGEFLEAECTLNDITRIQLIPVENGTYDGMTFYHMKDKVIVNKGSEQMIFDLLSGEIFLDGEKSPTVCKFLNLEVLEK